MKTIGIITIHKINNYGSVLQAFALQRVCEDMGYKVEIIDYDFPNNFQKGNKYLLEGDIQPNEPKLIKFLFSYELIRQHKGINTFVNNYLHLSSNRYLSPEDISTAPPQYDVYLTGSDQVWSPRHTNGDPTFMLHFAPDDKKKIAYAASIGSIKIPKELQQLYRNLLGKYQHIAIREDSGRKIISELTNKEVQTVLDPTLLLNRNEWDKIAAPNPLITEPYILCYFLNYSFNAFPYVDELAAEMQRQTGYKLVHVARPPHQLQLNKTKFFIGATPHEFISLIRDATMVLTTSFHGTAFAANYGKPVFTIIENRESEDSRQIHLMTKLGLSNTILTIKDPFPNYRMAIFDLQKEQQLLEDLRHNSLQYLRNALNDE